MSSPWWQSDSSDAYYGSDGRRASIQHGKKVVSGRGYTYVFDEENDRLALGEYKPGPNGHTAHQRLAHRAKIDRANAVGGSVKPDGSMEHRSRSINETNYGVTDMSGTYQARRSEAKFKAGDYDMVHTKRSKSKK